MPRPKVPRCPVPVLPPLNGMASTPGQYTTLWTPSIAVSVNGLVRNLVEAPRVANIQFIAFPTYAGSRFCSRSTLTTMIDFDVAVTTRDPLD